MSDSQPCGPERRLYPRFVPLQDRGPAVARLRPGREVTVVNLSRGGLCVEAMAPLRPGHPVDIRLTLPDWHWHGEALVLRCQVSALPRDDRVRYRAGLRFPSPVPSDGAAVWPPYQLNARREDPTRRVVAGTN